MPSDGCKIPGKAIKEDRLEEVYPSHLPGLLLVCNSGEEGWKLKGVRKICEKYGNQISAFCTFDSQLDKLVDQAVGSERFRITVRTQGGHSFNDFGRDNAIEKLAEVISLLYRIPVPENGRTTFNVGQIQGEPPSIPLLRKPICCMSFAQIAKKIWIICTNSSML